MRCSISPDEQQMLTAYRLCPAPDRQRFARLIEQAAHIHHSRRMSPRPLMG